MNQVTVLFFATFRDAAGVRRAEMTLAEGASVRDFKQELAREFPGLAASMTTALVAVNREYAFDEELVPEGAEIGIFPPVSGGSDEPPTICMLSKGDVDLNDLVARISTARSGAVCAFTGLVRGVTKRGEGRETAYLEYEAYSEMAEETLRQVGDEVRARWPTIREVAVVHRVGRLEVGEMAVVIALSAAHRPELFDALRYSIDRLKEIVPVWKKEVFVDGAEWKSEGA